MDGFPETQLSQNTSSMDTLKSQCADMSAKCEGSPERRNHTMLSKIGAVVRVQQLYRGYRTRRRLADSAVLAQELWWQAIYHADLHENTVSFFKNPKSESAASRLDVGDGKEVEVEECPRSKLQENSIKYLGPKEREQYECIIIEGRFFHKQSRNLVDTKGKWIFVLSPTRRLYAGQKKRGKFHHSSFLAGGATIAAGTVIIENGNLKFISPMSGHYRPTQEKFESFLSFFKDSGVNLDEVQVNQAIEYSSASDYAAKLSGSGSGKMIEVAKNFEPPAIKTPHEEKDSKLQEVERETKDENKTTFDLNKWSTGAGPRIGSIADYPAEVRAQALEFEEDEEEFRILFGDRRYAPQEEYQRIRQEQLPLVMNLDAWKDPSTYQDWLSFGSRPIRTKTTLVGSFTAFIVGLKDAEINDHELLQFVRCRQCPYDKDAIKVLNSSSREMGYLSTAAAQVLSLYIDLRIIILEGEVACSRIGYVTSIRCVVRVFANSADAQAVRYWMLKHGLPFTFGSYESLGLQEKSRIVKLGTLEPPKSIIKAELLDHQKEGLWWLVNKEKSDELPPFWVVKDGLYLNVLTRHQTNRRPEPLHGGIFADDHGLGKTLTFLSLIALDKVGNVTGGTGDEERLVAEESSCPLVAKKTLVVCPSAVCSTWEDQLQEHTQKGSLKLYKTKDAEELMKYDIVLTTYSTLVAGGCEPLMKIEWWRVILDEAHVITKKANEMQSHELIKLTARRRWAVTGSPIQNGSFDSSSLMKFLRLHPLSTEYYWQNFLQKHLANGDEKGFSLLQELMATISLRRIRDKVLVGLPSKTIETVSFELSEEERELYNQMEADSKNVVGYFITANKLRSRYMSVLFSVIQLRQLCSDSALCSMDLRSLLPSDNIGDASKHPELLRKMIDGLRDGEDTVCTVCLDPPTDATITICEHLFCRKCICYHLQLKENEQTCPNCRRLISLPDLFSAPPEYSSPENPKKLSRTTPSKVTALIKLLKESSVVNSTSKSVVFSLFDKMLALMEEPLKDAGFNTLRLDASTDEIRQAEIIKEFGSAGAEMVLLASLKTSGTGINLTAASTVYLLEPWWNSAVEEQAINRVHQYGQKENVRIVRLIAQNSIEERILEMQERKKVASEDFGRQGPNEQQEASIDDLCRLLF
uniref:RING-type domain-containing protein n=1 Tax=Salix viminalis TaxID=40686 RepID=A0A6N2N875_SALVM